MILFITNMSANTLIFDTNSVKKPVTFESVAKMKNYNDSLIIKKIKCNSGYKIITATEEIFIFCYQSENSLKEKHKNQLKDYWSQNPFSDKSFFHVMLVVSWNCEMKAARWIYNICRAPTADGWKTLAHNKPVVLYYYRTKVNNKNDLEQLDAFNKERFDNCDLILNIDNINIDYNITQNHTWKHNEEKRKRIAKEIQLRIKKQKIPDPINIMINGINMNKQSIADIIFNEMNEQNFKVIAREHWQKKFDPIRGERVFPPKDRQ